MVEECIYETDNKSLSIILSKNVFKPTGTSRELIKATVNNIEKPGKLLDLGCGSGFVGLALYLNGKLIPPLYASDLNEDSVNLLKKNALRNNFKCIVNKGSIFDPWQNEKFDYIVNDISGISDEIAPISPWFKETSCMAGKDGTELVVKALEKSPQYLNNGGKFFFPVLSFSNANKIISFAKSIYSKVELLSHKEWIVPDELKKNMEILKSLKLSGYIDYKEKFGLMIWYTDIYVAYKPLNETI